MNIAIKTPYGFSEAGKSGNNEDYIFPQINTVSTNDRLFLVCDGIGGGVKGATAGRNSWHGVSRLFFRN